MYVGFTGTQIGITTKQEELLTLLLATVSAEPSTFFMHGDCIGADAQAHDIAARFGLFTIAFPPIDPRKRAFKAAWNVREPAEYLDRNKAIVSAADLMLACPKGPEIRRSGTWSTIRYAKRLSKHLIIIYPDGTTERFNTPIQEV